MKTSIDLKALFKVPYSESKSLANTSHQNSPSYLSCSLHSSFVIPTRFYTPNLCSICQRVDFNHSASIICRSIRYYLCSPFPIQASLKSAILLCFQEASSFSEKRDGKSAHDLTIWSKTKAVTIEVRVPNAFKLGLVSHLPYLTTLLGLPQSSVYFDTHTLCHSALTPMLERREVYWGRSNRIELAQGICLWCSCTSFNQKMTNVFLGS